jgi:hypothetical protein
LLILLVHPDDDWLFINWTKTEIFFFSDLAFDTTTRMAGNFVYESFLVFDTTAAFNKKGLNRLNRSAELIGEIVLASLNVGLEPLQEPNNELSKRK